MKNFRDNFEKNKKPILIAFVVGLICFTISFVITLKLQSNVNDYEEVKLSTMTKYLASEEVKELDVDFNKLIMQAELKNGKKVKCFYYIYDYEVLAEKYIVPQSESGKLKVKSAEIKDTPWYIVYLPTFIILAMVAFMLYYSMGKGLSGMLTGSMRGETPDVRFEDVRGMDEEKKELEEVVDFLKNPEKYTKLGARIPKGVLLFGKPGTGKTFISKAVAGEVGVPFYSVSGSSFVEMFVGLGARRVRDLFKEARKNAPCIIFIDELDSLAAKRGSGIGNANDERESTLNELLVQMDGFNESEGIIILGATNRPDVLDPAIMRAGRFDRQVIINLPDVKGRESIFELYMKDKVLADDVNPEVLAKRTPGFTPADIENLANEAAILAARWSKDAIDMEVIEEAITKLIAGNQKRGRVIPEREKRLTSYHEVGHAITAKYLETLDPVHQISIIPRGFAGGFTLMLPTEDKLYGTKKMMEEEVINLLGGRAAELLKMDDVSTGASNDIERATKIVKDMIMKYGFNDNLGIVCLDDSKESFLGADLYKQKNYSEQIASEVDMETRRIMNESLIKAKQILIEHDKELEAVAKVLYDKETLTGEEFERICAECQDD